MSRDSTGIVRADGSWHSPRARTASRPWRAWAHFLLTTWHARHYSSSHLLLRKLRQKEVNNLPKSTHTSKCQKECSILESGLECLSWTLGKKGHLKQEEKEFARAQKAWKYTGDWGPWLSPALLRVNTYFRISLLLCKLNAEPAKESRRGWGVWCGCAKRLVSSNPQTGANRWVFVHAGI